MRAILMSIKPRFVAKILNKEKTIEIRKSYPKCELPIQVYIYCTKSNYLGYISKRYIGKVVAKFTLNKVEELPNELSIRLAGKILWKYMNEIYEKSCLTDLELLDYLNGKIGYAWHISNLEIFDRPLPLQPYFDLKRPPESWCYIESEK